MQHLTEHFQTLSKRKVRIWVIVENLNDKDLVKRTFERIRPDGSDFEAKLLYKSNPVPYEIFDHEELLVGRKKETVSSLPCAFWTNSRSMVQFFEETFNEAWNSRHAISIYPQTSR